MSDEAGSTSRGGLTGWIIGTVVGLLVGGVIGVIVASNDDGRVADLRAQVADLQRENTLLRIATTDQGKVTSTTPAPSGSSSPPKRSVVSDGSYLVGTDMKAGTYRSAGADGDSVECIAYASRQPNETSTYLRGSTHSGPSIITLNTGEYFNVVGCQPWRRQVP